MIYFTYTKDKAVLSYRLLYSYNFHSFAVKLMYVHLDKIPSPCSC